MEPDIRFFDQVFQLQPTFQSGFRPSVPSTQTHENQTTIIIRLISNAFSNVLMLTSVTAQSKTRYLTTFDYILGRRTGVFESTLTPARARTFLSSNHLNPSFLVLQHNVSNCFRPRRPSTFAIRASSTRPICNGPSLKVVVPGAFGSKRRRRRRRTQELGNAPGWSLRFS